MFVDIETALGRELREVADSLHIPAAPPLPQQPPRAQRHWQPMLVAAVVVLIVLGAVAAVTTVRGGREPEPALPSPSPSRTESGVRVPTGAPTIPYVLDQRLYVDGEQVPGAWWSVRAGGAGWIALRTDNTWWWGRGPEANRIEPPLDLPPVISPNGRYVAMVADDGGQAVVTGFATEPDGEGMGGVPVYPGNAAAGDPVRVRAVTDDGKVIVQGSGTDLLWRPLVDNDTVDLTSTAPGQQILGNTPAGLVVTGENGDAYLAEVSDAGELSRIGAIPAHDDLVVSPGAVWLAWTPLGTLGGEVTSISTLQAQTVDGDQQGTLTAPDGWGFRVLDWAWEDDAHLVSPVIKDGGRGERMARCSVESADCVLIDTD